ncbi:MAG: diguanylate cyclase [Thermoleophilia bacterium]
MLDELRDDAEQLLEDSWALRSRLVQRRELIAEGLVGAAFVGVAAALWRTSHTAVAPGLAALLVVVLAVLSRIRFPVGVGSVAPTQLVLVPMLLMLPPGAVPLLAAGGLVLGALGALARRRTQPERVLFALGDAWYTVGPAAVLVGAGFAGGHIPDADLLLAAFAAGAVADLLASTVREAAALGVAPELQMRVIALAWVADACLAPVGLLAAAAALQRWVAVLLVVPAALLLWLLARDRDARIEEAQRRLELVAHERARLQLAVRRMGEAFGARLNLDELLDIVLRGSVEALDAEGGRLVLQTPDGERMVAHAADGLRAALKAAAAQAADGPAQAHRGDVYALAVPLPARMPDGPRGVISLARSTRGFGDDEVALLTELAGRAGTAAGEIVTHERMRHEVTTDALTGLGNRRRLRVDLDRVLRLGEDHPTLLLVFDLDGFKVYNDTFGHMAGDALLTRLGGHLERAVAEVGTAYRLGGDEFCALIEVRGDGLDAVIAAAEAALTETGEGFRVHASYGAVLLPHEAQTPEQALGRADERMYAKKAGRASGAREQAIRVLRNAVRARRADLDTHSGVVADLGAAVAQRLGLDPEEREEVVRAAELHNVGMVGIPDTILAKPGPLDPEEWRFIRQHTVLGERILNAAPALRPLAPLVRACHERWDGHGYPDRLAGEDIPLGARIIAACEAYVAMTTPGWHRAAMDPETARRELRTGAGTQFDPRIVDALLAELAAGGIGMAEPATEVPTSRQIGDRVRGLLAGRAPAA